VRSGAGGGSVGLAPGIWRDTFELRMSGWSGLTALEKLSRDPKVPPVVVITAFGSDEVHERAERAGAAAVLDKPFDLPDLTSLGRRVIARHAA